MTKAIRIAEIKLVSDDKSARIYDDADVVIEYYDDEIGDCEVVLQMDDLYKIIEKWDEYQDKITEIRKTAREAGVENWASIR